MGSIVSIWIKRARGGPMDRVRVGDAAEWGPSECGGLPPP